MGKTLLHDIEHHAEDKAGLVYTLALLFTTDLNPAGWQSVRSGKGNNSWRIYLKQEGKPTKIWYFTGYNKGTIQVRNEYWASRSDKRFTIRKRADVIRFVQFVIKEGRK